MGPLPAADISLGVTLAVLGAGFLHALWNALLKSAAGEPMLDTALIVAGSCAVCFPLLPFVPLPAREAWPFALASMVIHFAYYGMLAGAYKRGDLSFAYPLMRGVAPLIVTILGVVFLAERLDPQTMLGIGLICAGIITIAWFASGHHTLAAASFALGNAVIIAIYTLVDGAGARAAGNPWAYVIWLMCLEGVPFLAWILWTRGPSCGRLHPAPLAPRRDRGRGEHGSVRDRPLGDDTCADRDRGRVARSIGRVRGADGHAVPQGELRLAPAGRRGRCRGGCRGFASLDVITEQCIRSPRMRASSSSAAASPAARRRIT